MFGGLPGAWNLLSGSPSEDTTSTSTTLDTQVSSMPVMTGAEIYLSQSDSLDFHLDALVGLGWSSRQADDAVAAVKPQDGERSDVSALLRAALRELGR